MKKKYQNAFFIFGVLVLAAMLTQLDFRQAWEGLQKAGYWFVAVIALWAFLYIFNTTAWYIIIKSGRTDKTKSDGIGFWWLYKVTVSAFALNYATPGGLMGGEPYRIMMLSPKIGTQRASSSTVLYVMTHIFSHFWFWFLSVLLYIAVHGLNVGMGMILGIITLFCILGIGFFLRAYRKGVVVVLMNMMRRLPLVKRWALPFFEKNREKLENIDLQIASLRGQNPGNYIAVVMLELTCRVVSALEIYFVLMVISQSPSYLDCILILALTSLIANLLFFMPLQLGGREGGFLLSTTSLGITTSGGVFLALIVRIRELIWTFIGLLLIKIDKKSS